MKNTKKLKSDSVDSSWSTLYRIGGISAIAYILFALVIPFFMFINHTQLIGMVNGAEFMDYILTNGITWWVILQSLVLCGSFFAIIAFAAIFFALKGLDKSWSAIGSLLGIVMHVLFIAYYPVLLGLTYLAQNFQAADAVQKASLATAAEGLLAMNNAFNYVYEPVFAISILILSIVMLKGVFDRKIAYLGILTSIVAFIVVALIPLIGVAYFWWWMLFNIWFVAVGIRLFRLSRLSKSDGQL